MFNRKSAISDRKAKRKWYKTKCHKDPSFRKKEIKRRKDFNIRKRSGTEDIPDLNVVMRTIFDGVLARTK